jgi:hypothetical protein
MGGPALKPTRQRSQGGRSSGPAAIFRLAARASSRAIPPGVNCGTRPSGGSMTSDVRLVETTSVPKSIQKRL